MTRPARNAIGVIGLISLAAGLWLLAPTAIGFTPVGVVAGVAAQLPTTAPAAVLITLAFAANAAVGAAAVRAVRAAPFRSVGDALLAGTVGAVVVDALLVMALTGIGLFRWWVLIAVHAAVLGVAGARVRAVAPLITHWRPRWRASAPVAWVLVGVVWSVPVVLQLASPVVPFLDVLPNHVAPVEHLRAFGSLDTLGTAPSPIYGPSRVFIGYVAVLGTLSTGTGLQAAAAVAAFALPLTVVTAVGMYRLARVLFGRSAGFWALLTVPLTVIFLRLPDARASVLVFAAVAWSVTLLVDRDASEPRRAGCLAVALAAGFMVHPLMGALTMTAVAGLVVGVPGRYAGVGVPGLAGGIVGATPQAATMLGLPVPPWGALVALPLAAVAVVGVSRIRLPIAQARPAFAIVAAVAALLVASRAIPGAANGVRDMVTGFPVLAVGAALAVSTAARRGRWAVPVAGVATLALAAGVTAALPSEHLIVQSLQYEVPKTLAYWGSLMLALAAAAGLRDGWRSRGWPGAAGPFLVAAFVVVAALPLRDELRGVNDHEEYRLSESASVALHHAERGYWQGYPDSRLLADAEQRALVDALRAEVTAGRLTGQTSVLHVAGSFQQWASTPLGVLAGVMETAATLDPESSIHTIGGRLRHVNELPQLLEGDFRYVMLETGGLDRDARPSIIRAGYRSIFMNGRGELFRR